MESSTAAPSRTTTGSSTIADMMALAAERYGERAAVRYKRDGAWHDVTFAEVGDIVSETISPTSANDTSCHAPSRL